MTTQSSPAPPHPRAWLEVDLDALRRNAAACARQGGRALCPMIKADAYGLGAVPVARALEPLDPWGYGVATTGEGEELRRAGITRRIVVFSPLLAEDFAAARAAHLTPTLGDAAAIAAWTQQGGGPWHLAIETGMMRAGVRWDEVGALGDLLRAHPPEGAFTHFHSAERDDGSRELQEARFQQALAVLPARPAVLHTQNSAGIAHRDGSPWDVVRPGVFLYGVAVGAGARIVPEPVVHLRARVIDLHALRDGETVSYGASYRAVGARRIATLGIGYADGYRRHLGNRGTALLHGRATPVAGMVTMDMTMLDVTDVPCAVGDVATLMGRDGDRTITVDDVAAAADFMSPYELLTGLRQRVPRIYRGGA